MKLSFLVLAVSVAALITPGMSWSDPAVSPPSSAPAPNDAAPSSEALALAKQYFTVVHLDQMMHNLMKSLIPAEMADQAQSFGNLTPAQQAAISDATQQAMDEWMPVYFDRVAVVYARVFTVEELRSMVQFYESPIGQSIMSKSASLAPAATQIMQEGLPELKSLIAKHVCERLDCRRPNTPPAQQPS